MTQKDLINTLAQRLQLSRAKVERLLEATTDVMSESLLSGKTIQLQNFGTFEVKNQKERQVVNPKTGERSVSPAKTKISFKQNVYLKEQLKDS